jgi:hypothetical protein
MSEICMGGSNEKPTLKLEGKKITIENIGVFDGELNMCYRRETVLHFDKEDEAKEYYYKKR